MPIKSPTHSSWINMRQRCNNPRHKNFGDYGGRGVGVCRRWDSFANFLADMGEKPAGMTLERIRVNEGYSPDNCRWASRAEQSRNRRDTVMLTRDGVTRSLVEWAALLGLKPLTIHMRLHRGDSDEQALRPGSRSLKRSNRYLSHGGKSLPVFEWAKLTGIPRKVLTLRLFQGWSVERTLTTPLGKPVARRS